LNVVALSISAPGNGTSEGAGATADDARPIFAAAHDIRASWLYQYAFALMRAITYLATDPDVDPQGSWSRASAWRRRGIHRRRRR